MSLVAVAVLGATIAHSPGSPVTGGVFVITATPSTKVIATAGVYAGPLPFTFTGGTHPGGQPGTAAGAGSITPGATKVLAGGLPVVLEGDSGTMNGTYVPIGGGPAVPFSSSVEVDSAGQSKMLAS